MSDQSFLTNHPLISRVLVFALLFGSGCFEAFVMKHRDLATATWFMALVALAIWIGYPLTVLSQSAAVVVFLCGFSLIVIYRRRTS
jgi:hypothetical protein